MTASIAISSRWQSSAEARRHEPAIDRVETGDKMMAVRPFDWRDLPALRRYRQRERFPG